MEINEDELSKLIDQKVDERLSQVRRNTRPVEWQKLSKEIQDYTKQKYDKDGSFNSYKLISPINTIIRFSLGVKNVYYIDDTNIDQARKVFEQLKEII